MNSATLRSIFRGDTRSSSAIGLTDADINRLDTDLLLVEEAISQITNGTRRLSQGVRPLVNHWSALHVSVETEMQRRYRDLQERCLHLEEKLQQSEARCHHLEMVMTDMKSTLLASIDERFRRWEDQLKNPETRCEDNKDIPSLKTRISALEDGVKKAVDVMLPRVNDLLTRFEHDSDASVETSMREEAGNPVEAVAAAATASEDDVPDECPVWFFPWNDVAVDEKVKALCEAAKKGKVGKVRSLLQAGANVNGRDNIGYSALYVASVYGHEKVIELLLQQGADVHIRGCGGKTALHCGAMNGHAACIPLLVRGGADVRARDHTGWTPMHHAAANGHPDAVRALLRAGARACARDTEGLTPADFANKPEVVNLLLGGGGESDMDVVLQPAYSW